MADTLGIFERRRTGSRVALIVSLIAHLVVAILITLYLASQSTLYDVADALDVTWIEILEKPPLSRKRLKVPTQQKLYDPERPVALKDPDKLMRQARNRLTEVAKLSDRVVTQDVLNADAVRTDRLPDLMTAADLALRTDVTTLSEMRALPGETAGKGRVTGRTRVKGSGLGSLLFNRTGAEGLLGGGGNPGVADPLNIIDFLRSRGDHGRIIYVLDVSASMAAAGLYKLDLAKQSLLDHIYLLSEEDEFNIITFASRVSRMSPKPLPATSENLDRAKEYLDRFTQQSISENLGTNTLGALESAFSLQPDVVVLLTDGLPTSAGGQVVETDPDKIIRAVRQRNTTRAALFIVGMEIDNLGGPGELLLRKLAEQTSGKIKFVGRDELLRYRDRFADQNGPNASM